MQTNKSQRKQYYKRWVVGAGLGILVIVFYWLKQRGFIDPSLLQTLVEYYPQEAPIVFILIYILLTVALVPTLPLNVGSGFLWGIAGGTLFSVVGASLGAFASFMISRYVIHDYFRSHFDYKAWRWLHQQIEQYGWKSVAFTRINPIFSFGPLNYFFGITTVSLRDYVGATVIFLIPPSMLMASLGHAMGSFILDTQSVTLLRHIMIFSAIFSGVIIVRLIINRRITQNSTDG